MNPSTSALSFWLALAAAVVLSACGGGGDNGATTPVRPAQLAQGSDVTVTGVRSGVTPFIGFVELQGAALERVTGVRFTIAAKDATASRPVSARYATAALRRRGYAVAASARMTVPVFGLYAGHANDVRIELTFDDESTQALQVAVATRTYVDPTATYDRPNVVQRRLPGSVLGFDFFALKSGLGMPVVVDTDGEIRWVGVGSTSAFSSTFDGAAFVVGDQASTRMRRLELDGSATESFLIAPTYTAFHHNIDPGKHGLLVEVNASSAGVDNLLTVVADVASSGAVQKEWDLAAVLGDYMASRGDDAAAFVRPGTDWFHSNSATYDPADDSVIVSSRENFVVKLDYRSGVIRWIFGDPSKYWYTFPSLRAKALSLAPGGLQPIGQHATSITSDGLLMLFNDGAPSFNQPPGAAAGASRSYSAAVAYAIDAGAMTAREVWRFDHGQSVLSDICSSVYEGPNRSLLINYSAASGRTRSLVTGLDADRMVVFELEYASGPCLASWNAQIVRFDDLSFD